MGRIIFKLETRVGDTIFLVAKNEEEARKTASEYSSRFRANYRDIKCVEIGKDLDYLALERNYAFESPYEVGKNDNPNGVIRNIEDIDIDKEEM